MAQALRFDGVTRAWCGGGGVAGAAVVRPEAGPFHMELVEEVFEQVAQVSPEEGVSLVLGGSFVWPPTLPQL